MLPFIRAFLAKSFFKLKTNKDLILQLKSDSSLQKICGFSKVPSEATFSRRFDVIARFNFMEQWINTIAVEYHKDRIIGHNSRDSTAIVAREKPINKKNTKGKTHFWSGYKLHLDVSELGIPLTVVVTVANVHDSQVAIPMEKMTERKVTFLYSLMDAAYDAPQIRSYIQEKDELISLILTKGKSHH